MSDTNPLLMPQVLLPYADLTREHFETAIPQIIEECRATVANILDSQTMFPTWDDLVLAMDEVEARLEEVLAPLITLRQLEQPPEWLDTFNVCYGQVAEYQHELQQNQDLFAAYNTLANSEPARHYSPPRLKLLSKKIKAFQIAGIGLSEERKKQLSAITSKIAELEGTFNEQVGRANQAWEKLITDERELAGLSTALMSKLAAKALAKGRQGWLLTLDEEAIYLDIMRQCESRSLREELMTAYSTRASDQGPNAGEDDNGPVLDQLLVLRQQKAALLGYQSHAHLSLESKAAETPEEVLAFLRSRIATEKPQLDSVISTLQDLARSRGYTELNAWDHHYLAQQHSAQMTDISEAVFPEYFRYTDVLGTLISLVQRVFSIQLVEKTEFSAWHTDVQLFEVRDGQLLLGYIYIDPFARTSKMDGCWAQAVRNRRVNAEGIETVPVIIFHGNFSPVQGETPSLLGQLQLNMLFHEFGHCLQHILTGCTFRELSGINFLGRDASEFAGQLLEEWCWAPDVIFQMSRHYQTGIKLSAGQVQSILAARTFTGTLRNADELMRSLFDFELHRTAGDGRSTLDVLVSARQEAHPLPWPAHDRFGNAFDYMTTGYDAGYYVYEWARPLARQVFSRFEEEGVFNANTGKEFRQTYYTPGAEHTLFEFFRLFMGRSPQGYSMPSVGLL